MLFWCFSCLISCRAKPLKLNLFATFVKGAIIVNFNPPPSSLLLAMSTVKIFITCKLPFNAHPTGFQFYFCRRQKEVKSSHAEKSFVFIFMLNICQKISMKHSNAIFFLVDSLLLSSFFKDFTGAWMLHHQVQNIDRHEIGMPNIR